MGFEHVRVCVFAWVMARPCYMCMCCAQSNAGYMPRIKHMFMHVEIECLGVFLSCTHTFTCVISHALHVGVYACIRVYACTNLPSVKKGLAR